MLPSPVLPGVFGEMFPGRNYLFDLGSGLFDTWEGASSSLNDESNWESPNRHCFT